MLINTILKSKSISQRRP